MRSRTLLAGFVVATLVVAVTGTSSVAAGKSQGVGTRLAAAPDLLPALAVPKSTAERRAAWESLGAAGQQQVRDLFKARVAPAVRAAAEGGQAPRSARDLLAGRLSDPATTNTVRTARKPLATTRQVTGFDDDADGVPDAVENGVADAFTPEYHISAGELPGTGFGILANGTPQRTVVSLPPVPPVSNFRVQPLGFSGGYGFLRIDYLTLWNRDDGLDGRCVSTTILDLIGIPAGDVIRALTGHPEEQERSAILVAAPASGAYNTNPGAYVALDFFTTAHEGVPFFDQSMFIAPSAPVPAGGHVLLGTARSKHGTYTFNAEGYPIFQPAVIAAAYATIDFLYAAGIIDYITYLALLFLADDLFFGCVIERFQEQGGFYASSRTNVGEPGRPINASGFIEDAKIRDKLTTPLWIL